MKWNGLGLLFFHGAYGIIQDTEEGGNDEKRKK